MRIIQIDPGVDGWWALVEDNGIQHLLHIDDTAGRDAITPTEDEWLAKIPAPLTKIVEVETENGTLI